MSNDPPRLIEDYADRVVTIATFADSNFDRLDTVERFPSGSALFEFTEGPFVVQLWRSGLQHTANLRFAGESVSTRDGAALVDLFHRLARALRMEECRGELPIETFLNLTDRRGALHLIYRRRTQ